MLTSLLNKKTATIGIATLAVLGGGVAFGYPAGTALTVSASAAPSTDPGHVGQTKVTVSVSNANPTCATQIEIDGVPDGPALPAGTTVQTVYLGPLSGDHSVRARTVNCAKGQKEHAKSKFVVLDAKATGASTAQVRKTYRVTLTGFEPGTDVTVTATLPGSSPLVQVHDTVTADRRGDAKAKFKFPQAGTNWSVVTTVGGTGAAAPFVVNVS